MNNKEAIERLKEGPPLTAFHKYGEAISLAIKALEERPTSEWIPVSERLPEYSGLYLVSIRDLVTSLSFDGVAFNNKGFRIVVDAWQPLPEPYKEKGGEDKC